MSAIIRWEDPPGRRGGPVHDWVSIASALTGRPGVWAIVAICATSDLAGTTAHHIRNGKYEPLKTGFEALARSVGGEYRVYARYVGEVPS